MSILRPYQRQALDAVWDTLSETTNRVAVEMATGLGKTITFAAAADEWLDQGPRGDAFPPPWPSRVLVLVHTDELVRQAVDKIKFVTRGRWTVGVVQGQKHNDIAADIVVASVATLAQPGRKEQIRDVGLIIVDECHHAVAASYVAILRWFGGMPRATEYETSPNHANWAGRVPVLGFTATLSRSDGQGLGQVFQDMPFSRSLSWGIRHGYLIDLVPYTIKIPDLDTSSDSALDVSLADGIAPEAVVNAWLEKVDYPGNTDDAWLYRPDVSTVLFAPLVKSAQAFAGAFNAAGVKAEVVHGAMPAAERQAVLDRYESGTTTVLCNAMVLTEGWDSPRTMCVIVARPTRSVPLFVQMIGRGLRPWLDASAPPRAEQRCVLLCVQGTVQDVATVADLSDKVGEVKDGQSLLAMEDEWDLWQQHGDADDNLAYAGPVRVEQWDAAVQASSKAWKYTEAGAPYLPTAKRRRGYVFLVERGGRWDVFAYQTRDHLGQPRLGARRVATAPDLELAMALAEDEAQERGGNIGALLADKGRPWRKGVPSAAAQAEAQRLGLGRELIGIMESRAGGKAGKLSDLIDKVTASKVLDPIVVKIRARG